MAQQALKVTATFEYSGLPDYWGGNGARWAEDHACVFAYYGPETTLRDMINEWSRDDSDMQCKALWEESDAITDDVIRAALLEMLTDQGRAELDQIADIARELGEICGHDYAFVGDDSDRTCECCASDDMGESAQAIVMLAIVCDTCGQDAADCECDPAPQLDPAPWAADDLCTCGAARAEHVNGRCPGNPTEGFHFAARAPAQDDAPEIETRAEHRLFRDGRNASENPR